MMGHLAATEPGSEEPLPCAVPHSHTRVAGGTGGLLSLALRYTNGPEQASKQLIRSTKYILVCSPPLPIASK